MIILYSILTLGVIGLVFSLILGIASRVFHVEIDPRIEHVTEALPGANCGACGFAGCSGYAKEVVGNEEVSVSLCAPGGEEIAKEIAKILGREAVTGDKRKAFIQCQGQDVQERFEYRGIKGCKEAFILFGGHIACKYGCLGFGSCRDACPFGAISFNGGRLPVVDRSLCTGCGSCVKVCPKEVISIISEGVEFCVACNSRDKGGVVKKLCKVGCIGCKKCVKVCEAAAVDIENNLALIDYSKCTSCGTCAEKCPTHSIIKIPQ